MSRSDQWKYPCTGIPRASARRISSACMCRNTAEPASGAYAKVQDHLGLSGDLVATHIETWYHPLPWIGKEIDGVSCPDLTAVKNTKITCTAKSGSTRVTVPVSVVEVAGGTAPRVTWKFGR